MGILTGNNDETVTIIKQPTEALRKIMFGNGSEGFIIHSREDIMNDGTKKKTLVILPTNEFLQMNNIHPSELQFGRFICVVDANSIISLNDDPIFNTSLCYKTPFNKDTNISEQAIIQKLEIELTNLGKNFHVAKIELSKKDMELRRMAEQYINPKEIADMVVVELRRDLYGITGGRPEK